MQARLTVIVILAGFLAASCPAVAADRALIVAVGKYPFFQREGAPVNKDLRGPPHDARNMRAFLTGHAKFAPDNVKLLIDQEATREAILSSMQTWIIEGTSQGDRAFFYYSGHGILLPDDNGDEEDTFDEAIAPHDSEGDLATGDVKNLIRDDEIEALLAKLVGRKVTVVADSCHSGTISRDGNSAGDTDDGVRSLLPDGPLAATSQAPTEDQARANKTEERLLLIKAKGKEEQAPVVWSAASAAQLAFDRPDGLGGVFTSAFIDGGSGKADLNGDGQVTASELLEFVDQASERFCATRPKCQENGLKPQLEGLPLTTPLFANAAPDNAESQPSSQPAKPYSQVPAEIAQQYVGAPAQVAANVFAHANDFAIDVRILPGTSLKLQQKIQIEVSSAAEGRILLFDQSQGGTLNQVFPNRFSEKTDKKGVIGPNETLRIPDAHYRMDFQMVEKGPGVLIALVVDKDIDLSGIVKPGKVYDIVKDPKEFLAAVAEKLRAPALSSNLNVPNGRYHWAYKSVSYEVE